MTPPVESPVLPVAALRRLLATTDPQEASACDLCGGALLAEHEHVADVVRRGLRCACAGCVARLRPDDPAVRRIPPTVRRLSAEHTVAVWESLGAPVGVVFLLRGDDGGLTAHYPGAGGAVAGDLDTSAVAAAIDAAPDDAPAPEVQALLLDRRRGRPPVGWLVPVDRCYSLTERLRAAWQGIDGGIEVDRALDAEHDELRRRALEPLLDGARAAGDAVLHEGQVLYPFRADAQKNQWRWTTGIVWPRAWATHPDAEPWWCTASFLVHGYDDADVLVALRHQQLVHRTRPDRGDAPDADWDEAVVHEHRVVATLAELREGVRHDVDVAGGTRADRTDDGDREHRRSERLRARLLVRARRIGEWDLVEVRVENDPDGLGDQPAERIANLRHSLVGAQVALATPATVGSLRAPAPTALAAVGQAVSERLWTVQVDEHSAVATGLILPEPPRLSAPTAGDTGDGTEIEEMMALRVRTLLPQEKAAAVATDPMAARIVERLDGLGPDELASLHAEGRLDGRLQGRSAVTVGATVVRVGSRVRLRPRRTADAMDLALDGRVAVVDAVLEDLDGATLLRVTVEDDPGADLLRETGRGFHFSPDEVQPVATTIVAGVGNVFNADDGFGPAVIAELRTRALPSAVHLEDYGIRGVHLAWDLASHEGRAIVVDAIDLDQPPGTVVLLDPADVPTTGPVDGHDLQLPAVLAQAREVGGRDDLDVLVVGCVPASLHDAMELSAPVRTAVVAAADRIQQLLEED